MNKSQMFFPTSKTKLIVMTVCTFSIYIFYWFYTNWKILKETQGSDIRPFWRTFLVPIFCYSLFKGVRECAKENNVRAEYSPVWITVGYILFSTTGILPDPFSLMTFFLPMLPLLPVQGAINSLNAKVVPGQKINDKFSGWNIATIIFGVIIWGLLILAMTMPVPSA